jgi:uncharacterized protein involved in outer membrane biogenesis
MREIRAVTGLEPTIRGEVKVSLFPTAMVSFSDVTLGEARAPIRRSPPTDSPPSCSCCRC